MITRTVLSWRHDFATGRVVVTLLIRDDVEGTACPKEMVFATSDLPQPILDWEVAAAAGLNATLASG